MSKLRVLAWPAHSNQKDNPYNHILYNFIEKEGVPVSEYTFGARSFNMLMDFKRFKEIKIFHMHWPRNIIVGNSYTRVLFNFSILYSLILLLKLSGKKVVWTVHNLDPHEKNYNAIRKLLNRVLYRHVDGFISLNEDGVSAIEQRMTKQSQSIKFIPHLHYQHYYPNTISREEARKALTIPDDKFVFLFLGQIRRYKNILGFVKAFNELKSENKYLLIAGKVHHEVEKELEEAIEGVRDIKLFPAFVKDEDLQVYLNAADLVVTPYNQIFNSGSVFLNLSFGKPTLAPALGAIPEIQQTVGSQWITTYEGPLSSEHLEKAMNAVTSQPMGAKPAIDSFDPQYVANETLTFYQSLL